MYKFFYYAPDTPQRLEEEQIWQRIIDPITDIFSKIECREYRDVVSVNAGILSPVEVYTPSIIVGYLNKNRSTFQSCNFNCYPYYRGSEYQAKKDYEFLYHKFVPTHIKYKEYGDGDGFDPF